MKRYWLHLLFLVLAGCSFGTRGIIVMKVTDNEVHVEMPTDDLELGQKVLAFRKNCPGENGEASSGWGCERQLVGEGEVTRILSDQFSEVTFTTGAALQEGDTIEPKPEN